MIPKNQARELARKTTPDQINAMLVAAREGITDWNKPSSNIALSLGVAFNIMWGANGMDGFTSELPRFNAIRNFGEFLPGYEKPVKSKRQVKLHHEEPKQIGELWF